MPQATSCRCSLRPNPCSSLGTPGAGARNEANAQPFATRTPLFPGRRRRVASSAPGSPSRDVATSQRCTSTRPPWCGTHSGAVAAPASWGQSGRPVPRPAPSLELCRASARFAGSWPSRTGEVRRAAAPGCAAGTLLARVAGTQPGRSCGARRPIGSHPGEGGSRAGAGACLPPLGLFQSPGRPSAEPALSGHLSPSPKQQEPVRPIRVAEAHGCMTSGFHQDVSGGQVALVPCVFLVWLIDPTEAPSSSRLTCVAFLSQDHRI